MLTPELLVIVAAEALIITILFALHFLNLRRIRALFDTIDSLEVLHDQEASSIREELRESVLDLRKDMIKLHGTIVLRKLRDDDQVTHLDVANDTKAE